MIWALRLTTHRRGHLPRLLRKLAYHWLAQSATSLHNVSLTLHNRANEYIIRYLGIYRNLRLANLKDVGRICLNYFDGLSGQHPHRQEFM